MARNCEWKIYERSKHFQRLGPAWRREPKGGTTLMMGYLIFLAIIVLFSLVWHDKPARDTVRSDRTGANKRKEDPQRNHPLNS